MFFPGRFTTKKKCIMRATRDDFSVTSSRVGLRKQSKKIVTTRWTVVELKCNLLVALEHDLNQKLDVSD